MALELMDTLLNFLCPTSNAASQCQTFISAHSSVAPPFGQYIYFLFFPTVFLLLFLWIVFKDVVKANKGISLIASIAVYVFIIIQGLYPIFLWLGEAWIVVIFILGFLYLLTRRFRNEDGGGKGRMSIPGGGGGMSAVAKGISASRAFKKLTGAERSQAEYIMAQIELMESTPKGSHGMDAIANRIDNELRAFGAETSVLGKPVASEYRELFDKYKQVCKEKGVKVSDKH